MNALLDCDRDLDRLFSSVLPLGKKVSHLEAVALFYQHPISREPKVIWRTCKATNSLDLTGLDWFDILAKYQPTPSTEIVSQAISCHQNANLYLYSLRLGTDNSSECLLSITSDRLDNPELGQLEIAAQMTAWGMQLWKEKVLHRSTINCLEGLLGSFDHQCRQSLGIINLYLSLLEKQPLSETSQNAIDVLQTTVADVSDRLQSIVAMRDRDSSNDRNRIEFRTFLMERLQAFNILLVEKGLVVAYPKEPLCIPANRNRLAQIVDNLLSNAIAFSPVGGTMTWRWSAFSQEALIEVQDEGSGIPPGEERAIFTAGYSRKPGGSGLGLAIAQTLTVQSGGSLWASNLPQGGAQFTLSWPLVQPIEAHET